MLLAEVHGDKDKAREQVFVLFSSITLKYLELRSSNSKPPSPIIPFAIVAHAYALLLNNLSHDSCEMGTELCGKLEKVLE